MIAVLLIIELYILLIVTSQLIQCKITIPSQLYNIHDVHGDPSLTPYNLQVEYRIEPIGIDTVQPRFTYYHSVHDEYKNIQQYSYHIHVYMLNSNFELVTVWDSNDIKSFQHTNIIYNGKQLQSDTVYYWGIQYSAILDNQTIIDSAPSYSYFTTGLYNDNDWNNAVWYDMSDDNMLVGIVTLNCNNNQHSVDINPSNTHDNGILSAMLYIVGLGTYTIEFNHQQIAGDELHYHFTTYEQTVLYDTYDVTEYLHIGAVPNIINIQVANGWYSQSTIHSGSNTIKLMVRVTYYNGERQYITTNTDVQSNDNIWSTAYGPNRFNDIYIGEHYDSRYELYYGNIDQQWNRPHVLNNNVPLGELRSSAFTEPIRITNTYTPINIYEPEPNIYIYDFGQNIAGISELYVPGSITRHGMNITLYHSELLYSDTGRIQSLYTGVPGEYIYTMHGTGTDERSRTHSVYYGYRYIELHNYPGIPTLNTLTAYFVHTDLPQTNNILTSSPLINKINHATRMSSQSNYISIPTDCPQRERRGWLGDAHITSDTNIHNYYMPSIYTKYLNDIYDAQQYINTTLNTTDIPDCVPYYNHGFLPSDPAWGAAYTIIYYNMFKYYGDIQILTKYYDSVKSYVLGLIDQLDNDSTLHRSFFGDWCAGNIDAACFYPSGLVSTFYLIQQLHIMSDVSNRLELHSDHKLYSRHYHHVVDSFNKLYFYQNIDSNRINNKLYYRDGDRIGIQTTHTLPLYLDIVPYNMSYNVLQQLIDYTESIDRHVNVGIIGHKYVYDVLSMYNRNDILLDIMLQTTQPSLGYMITQDGTTLWETWYGTQYTAVGSRNHIMFGTQSTYYYTILAGIQQSRNSVAYQHIIIKPYIDLRSDKLTYVSASINTIRGQIIVQWRLYIPKVCGYATQNKQIQLQCIASLGTIQSIEFASYGTPSGTCGEYHIGQCHAQNTVSIIASHCINHTSCIIDVTPSYFNHRDPCPGTQKSVAIQASGCYTSRLSLDIQLPVGGVSDVYIPLLGSDINDTVILVNNIIIWQHNQFISTGGILHGVYNIDSHSIQLTVGNGIYKFILAVPAISNQQTYINDIDSSYDNHGVAVE